GGADEDDERRAGAEERPIGYRVLEPAKARDQQKKGDHSAGQDRGDDGVDGAEVVAVEPETGGGSDQRTELGIAHAEHRAAEEQALNQEERVDRRRAGESVDQVEPRRPRRQRQSKGDRG